MWHFPRQNLVCLVFRGLGPKLLGVFPGGRFEQFIPSRPLTTKEIGLPRLKHVARRVGQLLARIHALDVPVAKRPTLTDVAESYLCKLRKLNRRMIHKMKGNMVKANASLCPKEINCDVLATELDIMKQCLAKSGSPVVFSHNDLQELNILLHEKYTLDSKGNLNATDDETPFALIDFEYSSYNYRGFDFANFLCEHMIDYSNKKPPYYTIDRGSLPAETQQRLLINAYLDEIEKVARNEQDDSCKENKERIREAHVRELLTESRRFLAVSHLYWSIWSFELAEESPIEFDYVSYGIDRLVLYYIHKQDLLEFLQKH
ncbi:unnamed protein product [Enterobius vermicularis]|uniref:Choline/ethanolamine kinase n=1 Tax=Enterobius vermicularis TaxID=51028 RepID=A0A0N4V6P5_ENTVE|nr:unnamed protein product [Enterobius vermicularis]